MFKIEKIYNLVLPEYLNKYNPIFFYCFEVRPWSKNISRSLIYFQKESGAEHAFQVVFDLEFVDKDCFLHREPIIVPAKTFLSQLV